MGCSASLCIAALFTFVKKCACMYLFARTCMCTCGLRRHAYALMAYEDMLMHLWPLIDMHMHLRRHLHACRSYEEAMPMSIYMYVCCHISTANCAARLLHACCASVLKVTAMPVSVEGTAMPGLKAQRCKSGFTAQRCRATLYTARTHTCLLP